MSKLPIGIFDSGLGGLTVLRALRQRLPKENYIYFGDTARAPYGNRSKEEIIQFNLEIGRWLLDQGCKALVIACNTSTVLGMDSLAETTDLPVIGMREAILAGTLSPPGASTSDLTAFRSASIGFLATKSTVESGVYQKAFAEAAPACVVNAVACPDFVPLIEQGMTEGPEIERAIDAYLLPLREQEVASLVLGCTHYPFIAPLIAKYFHNKTRVVDPADSLADIVETKLRSEGLLHTDSLESDARNGTEGNSQLQFYCSGDEQIFMSIGSRLLAYPIKETGRLIF